MNRAPKAPSRRRAESERVASATEPGARGSARESGVPHAEHREDSDADGQGQVQPGRVAFLALGDREIGQASKNAVHGSGSFVGENQHLQGQTAYQPPQPISAANAPLIAQTLRGFG